MPVESFAALLKGGEAFDYYIYMKESCTLPDRHLFFLFSLPESRLLQE